MAHLIWAAKINNKVQHIRNVIQFVYLLKNNIIQYLLKIRDFASTPQELLWKSCLRKKFIIFLVHKYQARH